MLFIDETIRRDFIHYCEDIWITEDSVWHNDRRLAAFTITEDFDGEHIGNPNPPKYRVNQRNEISEGVFIYDRIFGADTVCECKQMIEEYVNDDTTQYIAKYKEFDLWQSANRPSFAETPMQGTPNRL